MFTNKFHFRYFELHFTVYWSNLDRYHKLVIFSYIIQNFLQDKWKFSKNCLFYFPDTLFICIMRIAIYIMYQSKKYWRAIGFFYFYFFDLTFFKTTTFAEWDRKILWKRLLFIVYVFPQNTCVIFQGFTDLFFQSPDVIGIETTHGMHNFSNVMLAPGFFNIIE